MAETKLKSQAVNYSLLKTKRQGGSSTNWRTEGTTNYDETQVLIQSGSIAAQIASGANQGTASVTFPIAFDDVPQVFFTVADQNNFGNNSESPFTLLNNNGLSASAFTVLFISRTGNVAATRDFRILWFAIGKKAGI